MATPQFTYDGSKYKVDLDNKLKINYICGDSAGPAWHEIMVPVKYMNRTGEVYAEMFQGNFNGEMVMSGNPDIVVMQRQTSPEALQLVREMHKRGIRVIYHYTDDFWEIPPSNPAKPIYTPELLRRMEKIMGACDMITCTTPYLKQLGEQFNDHVRRPWEVVETDVFQSLLPPPRRDDDDTVRIGWILTPHHEDDVYIIANSLGQVARRFPKTRFIFFGHYNATLDQAIPKHQTEAYAGVPVWEYYAAAASLDLDIGIAPVIAHPFNRGKSRRKWFEYSATSVCTICTDYETYSIGMEHMENCYKVKKNKPYKWTQGLEYLVTHPEERKRLAKNAYEHVHTYHNAEKMIGKWIDMYKRLMERPVKEM